MSDKDKVQGEALLNQVLQNATEEKEEEGSCGCCGGCGGGQ